MLDWDDLRFFLAVVRHRTLAAAAEQLHVAQSTVGRRLASLQAKIGVRLLQHTAEGYAPTLAGEDIRAAVERVEAEALSVEHAVVGRDTRMEGLVRVTSSQLLTSHLLAPCFAALHARHRGILIEGRGAFAAASASKRRVRSVWKSGASLLGSSGGYPPFGVARTISMPAPLNA